MDIFSKFSHPWFAPTRELQQALDPCGRADGNITRTPARPFGKQQFCLVAIAHTIVNAHNQTRIFQISDGYTLHMWPLITHTESLDQCFIIARVTGFLQLFMSMGRVQKHSLFQFLPPFSEKGLYIDQGL